MNWKLIFGLSLFGLVMAFASVSLLSTNAEFALWLPVFLICAYIIAKNAPGRYFLHGFMVSIANCVWVTGIHIIQSDTYLAHHAKEAEAYTKAQGMTVTQAMLATGPFIGIICGIILGLFAVIASKIIKKVPELQQRP